MLDVLNIGLISVDLIFANLAKFPELGKEVQCKDFMIKPGGAVNTATALAKLGLSSTLVTTVGDDMLGNLLIDQLKKTGLNLSGFIQDTKYRTSVSAVLSVGKERGFATYFAASDDEAIMKRIEQLMPQCRHVHAYMLDVPRIPIVDIAKKYNKSISIDTSWDDNIKLEDLKPYMEKCDIFFTNEIESCNITGKSNVGEAMDELMKHAKLVVLKLGSKGSMVGYENEIIRVPAVEVGEVKDTTGAGDLYAAGFIYGYLKGWDIKKTAQFASASGSVAVTFYGGTDEKYNLDLVSEYAKKIEAC
ncbi:hypothetical protein CDQ84_17870 [Clostridium thermosuccinogenes]|jgi:sugar/nucleoside kinase (ribokinase family)|uniref:Carbohydrate kinase PfkB domain-containing protein n=1 Tax=Clostridium thermosuccinogenes TaxID=84032 RepID=A0A2K2F879_9CLOT|nr:PfkB family carbohydrate kinase [Pseudoclostridium thermosuccinogenes]AUS96499.1 hypothetical protein CDO33_08675 [Pseudoclostridium thermosuccinogenes]PNT92838.1 hypothetical protein CDQ83_04565 [Pseudoclostridium thermosuccinogenes]PNT94544.1 hypothetical protein CDQ85_17830 [Pseudoclostridium thermosuccinogenes]PNT94991.1 hypothetical protein CDQ84_17870 [Pseudoclostridium thermosuccinogenes]